MRDFLELPLEIFPLGAAELRADPIIKQIRTALNKRMDYKKVGEIVSNSRLTRICRDLLIPCLLTYAYMPDDSFRMCISTIDHLEELKRLLKTCIAKECDYRGDPISWVLRLSPAGLQILSAIGVDILKGFGPERHNVLQIGSLNGQDGEAFFAYGFSLKVDPNLTETVVKDNWGNTPLHTIIANENHDMLEAFIRQAILHKARLDLTVKDKRGKSILLLTAKMCDDVALDILLRNAAQHPNLFKLDLSECDEQGRNGLHYGCLYKADRIIRAFAKHKGNASKEDKSKRRPVDYLVLQSRQTLTDTLASVAIDASRKESPEQATGFTPDIRPRNMSLLNHCLSDKAFRTAVADAHACNVFQTQKDLELVFRNLASKPTDCVSTMKRLFQSGVNVNGSGASGNTALHVAARARNVPHVTWLLAQGAASQPNAKDQRPEDLTADTRILALLTQSSSSNENSDKRPPSPP